MSVTEQTETSNTTGPNVVAVVTATFSVIVILAIVAYSVMANVVNWVAVDLLTYPVAGVAPFVVISGAILTIPILIPTALISAQFLN
ncbi:hypothetical protein DVK02_12705 [Halobellus sp. Atlit-31R]|nr:hypothetical protein DVK02_12705 [Halobellus sp. Atlit-31R]